MINVSRSLNNGKASKIDARLCKDQMISNARFHAVAKGHSKKTPQHIIKGATVWPRGEPIPNSDPRYNLELQHGAYPIVYDTKTGRNINETIAPDTGFIIYDWGVADNSARVDFGIKTFLGIGWKCFGPELLKACDCDRLRTVLREPQSNESSPVVHPVLFWTPFTIAPEGGERHILNALEPIVKRGRKTTILMRKVPEHLEWTVCCLGMVVSTIYVPLRKPLLGGDVQEEGGILLTVTKDSLVPELISPLQIKLGDHPVAVPVKTRVPKEGPKRNDEC
ncbi:MAG: hypothetical protein IOC90_09965 [Methylocystis sp.]|nr:hypothetical protein [Methylocystis sp.]MCA3588343.1 hypothetical protein [Methylocystis sp.]MCA3591234.1 hypothetical protein [Methylocystis sp.]